MSLENVLKTEIAEETADIQIFDFEIENRHFEVSSEALSDMNVSLLLEENTTVNIKYQKVLVNNKNYFVFTKNGSLYLTKKINKAWQRRALLRGIITKKNFFFFGLYSCIENKYEDCDNIILNGEVYGKLKRPFNFWKFKHIVFGKVALEDAKNSGYIHSAVSVGDKNGCFIDIKFRRSHKGINYFGRKQSGDSYFVIRSLINAGNIRIVCVPMSPEYKRINMFKNRLAWLIGKIVGHRNVVLMFEKETKKANESGYYVFEKIMERKGLKSKVFFVIDKDCDDFNKVYSKYPKNTLVKYSFKHYLYIYLSKYFVSSELSNHVINPRLYIRNLNAEIVKKPLVFLQHGIMFAKPVDNPAAAGFRKNSPSVNYYKSVISSDLEATQFYKCGFEDADLIKCGLPKFDISTMDPKADKIMIMLTYRFWEEALIINEDSIKETSYYKVYMNLINAFEKAGLLDKLLISCHPKFADCIIKAAPKYESIVEKDINRGLELSKIFITDYSSASYDAHYRGAYIIYYWKERDYLIENYQAIPPVNEYNCDGVPVFDTESLVKEVQKAIENNYVMDDVYEERYKKINEFHDNKNGERLVNELIKLDII